MLVSKVLSLLLVGVLEGARAQEALGFRPGGSTLGVTFGSNIVSPPGELIPRGDTANPPNITTPVWTSAGNAVLLMVDSDVPRNGTRVQLLHWLVSNVTLGSNGTLAFPGPGEAPYRQPSPPVGDSPHQYTFVLFTQPANFSVPAAFSAVLESRVFFNATAFASAADLGTPFAANSIRVQNLTGTPTTTFPPPRPTNVTGPNPPSEFPGAATSLVRERAFWVGLSTALLAGLGAFAL